MKNRHEPPIDAATSERAVGLILKDYLGFLAVPAGPAEAKEFQVRHAAGRAALAHLEQVLKLSGVPAEAVAETVAQAIAEARCALATPEEEEANPDAGGEPG